MPLFVLLYVPLIEFFTLDLDTIDETNWLLILPSVAGYFFFESRFAHNLLSLRQPDPNDPPRPDDDLFPDELSNNYEPTQDEIAEMSVSLGIPVEPVGEAWICNTCNEENTAEFRLCWSCGTEFAEPKADERS